MSLSRPFETLHYDLEMDPAQPHPIEDPAVERRRIEHLLVLVRANDAPLEKCQSLSLPTPPRAHGTEYDLSLMLCRQSMVE